MGQPFRAAPLGFCPALCGRRERLRSTTKSEVPASLYYAKLNNCAHGHEIPKPLGASSGPDRPHSMEADFVEAPSQMLEEWMRSPQVLASFARHCKTGETIPADLVVRMNRASAFGRAGWVSQQLAFTAISCDLYKGKPQDTDPDVIDDLATRRYTHTIPLPGTHTFASFGHPAGYSSAYYTYLWNKVIGEDFHAVRPEEPARRRCAHRYRRLVLEPGGSVSASDVVKQFLGRPQSMTAFQHWMNEEFESPTVRR